MTTAGSNFISGITTTVFAFTDVVNKDYVDANVVAQSLPSQTGNAGKFLTTTDGTNISWDYVSNYEEFTTTGAQTFIVPSYANLLYIEAVGAGGGGSAGTSGGSSSVGGESASYTSWYIPKSIITSNITVNPGVGGAGGSSSGGTGSAGAGTTVSWTGPGGTYTITASGGGASIVVAGGLVLDGLVLNLDAGISTSYPGSGTTWTDLSGNGNTGTLTGGPTYSSADGGSIVFDGTNDEVTTTTQFTNPQTFSVGAWFKTSTASGKKIIGFETNQTGTATSGYDRQIYIGSDGKLYFGIYDGATKTAISPLTYNDNNWHYVVGTYGSEGTTMRLYVDGVSVATETANFAQNYAGWWRIAGYNLNSWTNASNGYFTGNIAQALVYNRALSVVEIQQNYNALAPRFGAASVTVISGLGGAAQLTSQSSSFYTTVGLAGAAQVPSGAGLTATAQTNKFQPTGGGSGAGSASNAGGAGGTINVYGISTSASGGTSAGTNGTSAVAISGLPYGFGGGGGGAGASNAGNGGNGVRGGGGGGGASNTAAFGNGGNGGNGYVKITWW
jgi:hypothetical protein